MHGWEVVSLDIDPKMRPTLVCDICAFDYKQLGGTYDAVWCSPPCTHYSIARSKAKTPRDLEGSDRCVQRCIDIIRHFAPASWFIENPQSGLLKHRQVVAGLPYVDEDYCKFAFPYRERTRIWTNTSLTSRLCRHDCGASDGKKHTNWAQKAGKHRGDGFAREDLYNMPPLLCEDIFQAARQTLAE